MRLVVGADGGIGRALADALVEAGHTVRATTRVAARVSEQRPHFDLGDDPGDWKLPDGILHAYLLAGVTSLAACARDPEGTRLLNVERTLELAQRLAARGASLMFVSSNLVFDGSEPRVPVERAFTPTTEYGRQKANVEVRLAEVDGTICVLRLTKVLGPEHALLNDWRRKLVAGQPVRAFSNRSFAPVGSSLVTDAMAALTGHRGVFQISAADDIGYVAAARRIAERLGASQSLVRSVSSDPELEPTGPFASLDMTRTTEVTGLRAPAAAQAIDAALEDATLRSR